MTSIEELEERIKKLEMAFDTHGHRIGFFGMDRTSSPVDKKKNYMEPLSKD